MDIRTKWIFGQNGYSDKHSSNNQFAPNESSVTADLSWRRFVDIMDLQRGCQMVYFQAKNPTLGKFLRALDFKLLMYFIAVWNICQTFGIFFDHLVHFVFIWYIFPVLASCTKKNLATLICNIAKNVLFLSICSHRAFHSPRPCTSSWKTTFQVRPFTSTGFEPSTFAEVLIF
jgi:hypothetical protein